MLNWISTHIPPWVWIAIVAHLAVLGTVAYLILLERKVASWVQDRIGPNRVGLGFGIIPFLKDMKMRGLGQPLADGLKFILKEDYRPRHVDRILFTLAPAIMITVVIISIAVLPWGGVKQGHREVVISLENQYNTQSYEDAIKAAVPAGSTIFAAQVKVADGVLRDGVVYEARPGETSTSYTVADVTYRWPFQIANLNIGVLYILAVLSLAVYGVVIGGWASNNKYSFLGGLRATANMISYEIPLGLSVLAIVVIYGTLDLSLLVEKQAHYWLWVIPSWNIFTQPLGFLLFLVCIHAEANRAPFDLAEAEQELVGGYHTEYSSMRFALFFLAEYAGMITTSAVCVALFFGGWHLPWVEKIPGIGTYLGGGDVDPLHPAITTNPLGLAVRAAVFYGKTLIIIFVFMWVRWSLPRFRFDQLMMLAWRSLIPISLALVMLTSVVVYLMRHVPRPGGVTWPGGGPETEWVSGWEALVMLVANALLFAAAMAVSVVIPPAPATNRRLPLANSRFRLTPLPGRPVSRPAIAVEPRLRDSVPADPLAQVAGNVNRG
jgi:NADH-quinone oxidoreductase subunit H